MFDEMAPFYRPFKSAKRNSDRSKIHVLLPQRRDASLFPFRFITPWSTTALNSTTNTLSHTSPIKQSTARIHIDKVLTPRRNRATDIPWNLTVKKYTLLNSAFHRDIPS
jgi:hypothetical protein